MPTTKSSKTKSEKSTAKDNLAEKLGKNIAEYFKKK